MLNLAYKCHSCCYLTLCIFMIPQKLLIQGSETFEFIYVVCVCGAIDCLHKVGQVSLEHLCQRNGWHTKIVMYVYVALTTASTEF